MSSLPANSSLRPKFRRVFGWWSLAMLGAGLIGVVVGYFGLLGAAALAALAGAVAVLLYPELIFWVVLGSSVLGQLVRLPIGDGGQAILPNDVLLPILIVAFALRQLGGRSWRMPRNSLWLPIGAVALTMGLSLWLNRDAYVLSDLLSGGLYFVRWLEYAALFFITLHLATKEAMTRNIVYAVVWSAVITSLLGFVQLKVFPDFSFMAPKGWDPHIGRLLSTWFDPNFLAGYLSATVALTLSLAITRGRRGFWWWAATAILSLAIVLTYSRSGYLAFAVAFGCVTALRARWVLYLGALGLVATFMFVPRVQERVLGIRSVDETAQLRIVSWQNAARIISEHPYAGVGYNLYREAQSLAGVLEDEKAHSATGSDSSLLLITATTGFAGVIAYLWLYVAMVWEMIKTTRDRALSSEWRALGLGAAAGLTALFLHSQFVNGLLYPHIMQWIWIIVAALIAIRERTETA